MTSLKKMIAAVMFIGIFYVSSVSSCIGYFNNDEYTREVAIIDCYITQLIGVGHGAHKIASWLEKRIAYRDISPQCLVAIANLIADEVTTEDKKIEKLQCMMEHDKLTRVKEELASVKAQLEASQDREKQTSIERASAAVVPCEYYEQKQEVIAGFNARFLEEEKKLVAEQKRIEEERAAQYKRECLMQEIKLAAIAGIAIIITFPLAIGGATLFDGLAKNYINSLSNVKGVVTSSNTAKPSV